MTRQEPQDGSSGVILAAALTAGGGPGHDPQVVAVPSDQGSSPAVVMRTKLVRRPPDAVGAETGARRGVGRRVAYEDVAVETAYALVWLARARADQRGASGAAAALDAAREAVPSLCGPVLQRPVVAIEREAGVERPGPPPARAGDPPSEPEERVLRLLTGDLGYGEI
jgi:hypothetical protein